MLDGHRPDCVAAICRDQSPVDNTSALPSTNFQYFCSNCVKLFQYGGKTNEKTRFIYLKFAKLLSDALFSRDSLWRFALLAGRFAEFGD
jgi:hypothetical protein